MVIYLGILSQSAGESVRTRWEAEEESQYNQGSHPYRLTPRVLLEALQNVSLWVEEKRGSVYLEYTSSVVYDCFIRC